MASLRSNNNFHKKRLRRKRVIRWVLLPLMLISLSFITYGAFLFNKAESVMEESYNPIDREGKRAVNPFDENFSVLFIGVDDSNKRQFEGSSRTDALMLATFNQEDKSIKLLSIPRDSYVHIPEKNIYTKINHAHAYGGVELTLETVEELLDVPVDYYVKMNFDAFIDVIDALNGIEVNVPYTFTEQDSKDRAGAITLNEGLQTLDGEEALALARTRKLDNDIERGKRQQEIIKAIIQKAVSVKSIGKYTDVMEAVGKNLTTDLRFDQMKSFIEYATAGSNLNTETLNLAGSDSRIDGIYYYQLDEIALAETIATLQLHLNISSDNSAATTTDTTSDNMTTEQNTDSNGQTITP
ncbi:LCP family protein [Bacillus sp. ISL-35]|uniref:LCP family protein n=1 Tax=Bacillus sp. ISL-35 TaxID=2819122 RepID=UPI001BE69944|nr:LCP family protein [Bacillus sp. ISL-35]MBT2678846.1 LCP family protein [Bacillus sp. ISL-35]MBT2703838.1 LCP family protein [Chryseobacterium sp. ISL-80]